MPGSSRRSRTPKQPDIASNGPGIGRTPTGLNQRFVDILGWVITVAWGLSMILHALNIGYEPPGSIHILMMVVAGTAFGTNFIRQGNGDNDERK